MCFYITVVLFECYFVDTLVSSLSLCILPFVYNYLYTACIDPKYSKYVLFCIQNCFVNLIVLFTHTTCNKHKIANLFGTDESWIAITKSFWHFKNYATLSNSEEQMHIESN